MTENGGKRSSRISLFKYTSSSEVTATLFIIRQVLQQNR